MKVILAGFGLWAKVSPAYNPDGSLKSFGLLEKLVERCSRSEKAIIRAVVGVYHNKKTVSFTELYNALDVVNKEKLMNWWSKNFETKGE